MAPSSVVLISKIGRSSIRKISKHILLPSQNPDDISRCAVYVGETMQVSAGDEEVSFLVLVDTVDVEKVEGRVYTPSTIGPISISVGNCIMLCCPPFEE